MRFILFGLLVPILLQAQFKPEFEKKNFLDQNSWLRRQISLTEINHYSEIVANPIITSLLDTIKTSSPDSTKFNMYGDLLNDNPLYNQKSSWWATALKVTLANATTFLIDRYIFNYDFSRVGINSWKHNIQTGWEWDVDRFGMNYFWHPYSGSMFFNTARANGYSFFESIPFAYLGSLEWEYFAENTLPAYNDIINTPINGIFLGEIFYRLGSNILDDQTTGVERFFREMAVALLTPTRFFSRLLRGELNRLTPEEVYQKEPLNVTLAAGYHRINDGRLINERGSNSMNLNLIVFYGNPFEKRSRKPFDYFKVQGDLDFGVGRKIISLATGHGILFGRNVQIGNLEMLVGLFQQMNFFDTKTFELGTIAFGPGIISKLLVGRKSSFYTDLHFAIIPFGGLSNRFGPEITEVRDYNYGAGAEVEFESTYNISGWVDVSIIGHYWWLHTFAGIAGNIEENNYIGLIKPRITINFLKNLSIGFEHLVYYSDRYPRDFQSVHAVRTEQKIFLQLFLEGFRFTR